MKKRIGLLYRAGKLGYSIRANAFVRMITSSDRYELVPINTLEFMDGLRPNPFHKIRSLSKWWWTKMWQRESIIELGAKKLDRFVEQNRIDLLQGETPASIHVWLRSSKKCPCILDMHGLYYEELVNLGRIANKHEDSYWITFQKQAVEECSHLFAVSHSMVEYLKNKYPISSFSVLPNGADVTDQSAKYAQPLSIVYAGIFEYWEKVDDFLALAKENITSQAYKFSLIGDGRLKDKLLPLISKNVEYYGHLPREETFTLLSNSQIGMVPSSSDITRIVASPIKLFDYMSLGLPILTVDIGEWSDVVKKYNCGIVIKNGDPSEFSNSLGGFLDRSNWQEMSRKAKFAIESEYNWQQLITENAFPVYDQFLS